MDYLIKTFLLLFIPFGLLADVILVTGASRGIGEAIVKLLSEEGHTVYAGMRTLPINSQNLPNLHPVLLDVTDEKSIENAVRTVIENEGKMDVLINNAGIMFYGSVENVTIEEAQKLFDVNFFGVVRTCQAVLPIMRDQKKGRIIQISSRSGFRPLPSISLYAASKFALEGLSETMAAQLTPWNIKVTLIEPGPVSTDLDILSPYGSRLSKAHDPFLSIFQEADLFSLSPLAQTADEIAESVLKIMNMENPPLRYQTTEAIQKQAALRLVDPTGMQSVSEWQPILFPK